MLHAGELGSARGANLPSYLHILPESKLKLPACWLWPDVYRPRAVSCHPSASALASVGQEDGTLLRTQEMRVQFPSPSQELCMSQASRSVSQAPACKMEAGALCYLIGMVRGEVKIRRWVDRCQVGNLR